MEAAGAGPGGNCPRALPSWEPWTVARPAPAWDPREAAWPGPQPPRGHCHHSTPTGREPSGRPCARRPGCCRQRPISLPGGGRNASRAHTRHRVVHQPQPQGSPERSYSPGLAPPPAGSACHCRIHSQPHRLKSQTGLPVSAQISSSSGMGTGAAPERLFRAYPPPRFRRLNQIRNRQGVCGGRPAGADRGKWWRGVDR